MTQVVYYDEVAVEDIDIYRQESDGAPLLYGIHAIGTPYYKIGYSTDPVRRLAQVQMLAPQPLRIAGLIPFGSASQEAAVHRRLRYYRHRGEWFDMEAAATDLTKAVGDLVTPWQAVRFYYGYPLLTHEGRRFKHPEGWVL